MICRILIVLVALAVLLFPLSTGLVFAEESAIAKMLALFVKKGVVTPEEAATLSAAITKEQEELAALRKSLELRERQVAQREQEITAREQALKSTAPAPPQTVLSAPSPAAGAHQPLPLRAVYDNGFLLTTEDDTFSLRLGGLVQTDYRLFDYEGEDPGKDEFDLRRVRLRLSGNLTQHLDYKFEYEFEGTGSRNLLDAYADLHIMPALSVRVGQFKEPFSFEQLTKDENWPFAERSMGYYLTPQRDVGIMAHASLWSDRVNYGAGIFNGDGRDDSTSGEEDNPEFVARAVLAPFKGQGLDWVDSLQFGGSFSYADIDPTNVEIHAKTAGLTTFFDVSSNAKFNIIRDVDDRHRYGAEAAWAYGPVALAAEYFNLQYDNIETSSTQFDTELEDYYVALLWMVTGEHFEIRKGILQPIKPRRALWSGGWGAVGLALRFDSFDAGEESYDYLVIEGNSVREAEAYSVCIRWYLTDFALVALDATRTRFDSDLLIGRDALSGDALYSDVEDVVTARFQLGF